MITDRLRYFSVIANTQNLRRAAELLHLSPAALSKAVKQLEDELNLKLIVPAGRGIAITDEGKEVATRAESLLEDLDKLIRWKVNKEKEKAPLKLGSFEVFTTHFLGPLVNNHLDDTPLLLHEFVPGQLEQAVARREIDLGIIYMPVPTAGLDFLKVTSIEMGIFGLKDKFRTNLPFAVPITPVQGAANKVKGLDGWPDHEVPREVKYRVTMMESALELCRQGLAVAYLPKFVAELHNQKVQKQFQLHNYRLPNRMKLQKQDVYLIKRQSDLENSLHKKIAKAIRMICNGNR